MIETRKCVTCGKSVEIEVDEIQKEVEEHDGKQVLTLCSDCGEALLRELAE